MQQTKHLQIFLIATITLLTSCHPGRIHEEHRKMEHVAWKKHQDMAFEFEVEDVSASYDIYLAIRHASLYPFDNLLVSTVLTTPGGETRYTNYDFAIKDKEGNFLGDGLGDLWDINLPLRKGFTFSEPGTCLIELENRMLKSITPGIVEIGLIVERN